MTVKIETSDPRTERITEQLQNRCSNVSEEFMEQILLDSLSGIYDGPKVTNLINTNFKRVNSEQLNSFCDEMVSSAADGKTLDVIYPVFATVFRETQKVQQEQKQVLCLGWNIIR